MRISFDGEVAPSHAAKVTGEAESLVDLTRGAGSQDISNAYGIMCQFLAPDFMAMADSMDSALQAVRDKISSAASAFTNAVDGMVEVDDDAGVGFEHLQGKVKGL